MSGRMGRARPAATAMAAIATLCATSTVIPLFGDGRWILPVIVGVALVALAGGIARLVALPAALQPLLQLEVLLIWLTVLFARPEAALGFLPGPVALGTLQDAARTAVAEADTALAPVPTTSTLVLLAVGGIGLIAIIVDTIGVTLRLPGFAGVPLLVVCALPIAVIPGGVPWWCLPIAAAGWLGLLAVDARFELRSWGPPLVPQPLVDRAVPVPTRSASGSLRPAVVAGVCALAAALVLPTLTPGLAEPVYVSSGGSDGTGSGGVRVDPFASLRRYLLDIPDAEVLRYSTDGDGRPYLRLLTLDTFDGVSWVASPARSSAPITDTLGPPSAPAVSDVTEATYDIAITGLQNEQLPVPYAASRIEGDLDAAWQWNPRDRTVSAPGLSSAGLDYRVTSYQVRPSRSELRSAPSTIDPAVADLLAVPAGLTPDLARLAREVTADADTPYAKALALVRWFTRDGDFRYSTSVVTPEGADPVQSFLDERVGYCQQFAGTMALMARTLGIPARVAIGFTGGREQGGEHVVYARNAHAWPELWFDGVGWVWFEPTPRSDAAGGVAQPDYAEPREESGAPVPSASASAPESADRRLPPEERAGGAPTTTIASATVDLRWLVIALFALGGLAFLPVAMVSVRRRRRTSSPLAAERVEGAWRDLADSARDLGWSWPLAATPRNAARILAGQVRLGQEELATLTRLVTAVERMRYGPPAEPVDETNVEGAGLRHDIRRIRRAIQHTTGWRRRMRAIVLPASLRPAEESVHVDADDAPASSVRG